PGPHPSFFSTRHPPPLPSTLFPYTTLFRSCANHLCVAAVRTRGCYLFHWRVSIGFANNFDVGAAFALPREHGSNHAPRMLTPSRSEEHTSELQSRGHLVCRLLLEKKKKNTS